MVQLYTGWQGSLFVEQQHVLPGPTAAGADTASRLSPAHLISALSIRRDTSLIDSRPPRSSLHAPPIQAAPRLPHTSGLAPAPAATSALTATVLRDLDWIAAPPSIATSGRLIASSPASSTTRKAYHATTQGASGISIIPQNGNKLLHTPF
ncbi:hypothetical protein AOQ84DRAFT_221236 [Glonium stellatum]|uniref:Uncharacterized protein n=1 Tax=Glonium stellatum TaxID=574774 RepID=A0A8E2JTT7_9PEZI|nr:hypothetical protein AOQ84DRAFT_221236 [Glonium stellatum]